MTAGHLASMQVQIPRPARRRSHALLPHPSACAVPHARRPTHPPTAAYVQRATCMRNAQAACVRASATHASSVRPRARSCALSVKFYLNSSSPRGGTGSVVAHLPGSLEFAVALPPDTVGKLKLLIPLKLARTRAGRPRVRPACGRRAACVRRVCRWDPAVPELASAAKAMHLRDAGGAGGAGGCRRCVREAHRRGGGSRTRTAAGARTCTPAHRSTRPAGPHHRPLPHPSLRLHLVSAPHAARPDAIDRGVGG